MRAATDQEVADVPADLLKAYQSLVGALLYCAVNTRPDVAYAVGMLCRAMGKPTPGLYGAALRVLFYLHCHRDIVLRYGASEIDMSGMSDSDWAGKHSTTPASYSHMHKPLSVGAVVAKPVSPSRRAKLKSWLSVKLPRKACTSPAS